MQERSELYKEMMHSDKREVTEISIYMGTINQEAQRGAAAVGSFWKYADTITPLDADESVTNRYFAWEEMHNKLDGSMFFAPENQDILYNNGIVTEQIVSDLNKPDILFRFVVSPLNIKGLTVDFGDSYPKQLLIETNNVSREYILTTSIWRVEDVFEGVEYIRFIPGEMSHGATRFRIEKILFGIGISLTGSRKVLKATIKEKTHPISLELPTIDVSFEVDNQDRYFNTNVDDSVINFLERGQEVKVFFKQTLSDGKNEIVKGAHAFLDETWKDRTDTAEFTATDRLFQLDGIYEDGIYRSEGITAYDQLIDIFGKAGLQKDEYVIDSYLKTIILHNPVPKETFANCILLIANACRCVMRQDRFKRIIIKASFTPELNTFGSDGTDASRADRLLDVIDVTNYFDWQQGFNKVDGSMFFPPEEDAYLYAGYISKEISNENGFFSENPFIILQATASFTFYQLTLQFGDNYPLEVLIRCYKEGTMTEEFPQSITSAHMLINHAFLDIDKVEVEFTRATAYSRVHIRHITVAESTDFVIKRRDMFEEPVTERQSLVKEIVVARTVYSLPDTQTELYSETETISMNSAIFKMEFNDPSIPIQVITMSYGDVGEEMEVDYGAEITGYSNWYCTVRFNTPPELPVAVKIIITGYVYKVLTSNYKLPLNVTGIIPERLKNPLIDSMGLAIPYAEWCAGYYKSTAEYSVSKFMGDPVLESNDLILLEMEDGAENLVRIHTVTTVFDGAFNESSCVGRSANGQQL